MAKKKRRDRGYAAKKARGDMMYGPGCCAHDRVITAADRERFREMRIANRSESGYSRMG